ncbi:MAG: glycerol-3-phosphate dehydrogenase [Polyangiales bacterium]
MPSREQMWGRVPDQVDIAIVGGGITGAGIARDAARRGLRVALFEMDDMAYGTSSRSSKLIHGGLRYLESYEFSLVFESVSERRVLLDLAPHLVNPLAFLFPIYEGTKRSMLKIGAGMWLYEGLSLFRSPKKHQRLKPAEVADIEPILKQDGLEGAPLYYDCSTDDARLTLESALDAAERGALIATHAPVRGFLKGEDGRICGVRVQNARDGSEREVRAHAVINATGPWTDDMVAKSGNDTDRILRPTKGIHIVVEARKLPVQHAVVCFHPKDDRALFALPWGDRTYVGTTDTDYEGTPGEEHATSKDVDYLIEAANAYFPDYQIRREDVIATWAGLRALITAEPEDQDVAASKVSREHAIVVGDDGLITIAGGKLTTYRKMAEEVVNTAVQMLRLDGQLPEKLTPTDSEKAPLPGAIGWPEDDDHEKVAKKVMEVARGSLSDKTCMFLVNSYGMRAIWIAERCAANPALCEPIVEGRPEIMAQVDFGVDEELAATVSDIMIRRTQIFFRDFDQGLGGAEKVADRMASLIGWNPEERQRWLEAYRAEVALSRRWR